MLGGIADDSDDNHADENFGNVPKFFERPLLAWLYPLSILALAPAYFFIEPWWAGILLILLLLFGLNSVHTEINLELGARLLVINRKSKVLDESKNLSE
jgi:hypothetical protein